MNFKKLQKTLFLISYYTEIGVKAKQFRGEGECRHACEYLKYHTTYQSNNDGFLHESFEHVRGEYLSSSKHDTTAVQGIDIYLRVAYVKVIKMLHPIFLSRVIFSKIALRWIRNTSHLICQVRLDRSKIVL